MPKPKLTLNGKVVRFSPGQTLLQVARDHGVEIPTLCYLAGCTPTGACRMCLVEVKGARTLVASCAMPAAEGMEVQTDSEKVHSRNVRVRIIGRRALLPDYLVRSIERVEAATAGYSRLGLNIALGYGGRDEIIDAVNRALSAGVSRLDEGGFRRLLYLDGVPDPDILIRTGGEKRISNFLLFYISYTELFFLDKYWPELTRDDIAYILDEFYRRQRRYGK